jgi:D-tyrosyl-tRNA(Tyr) deacylase
VGEIGSGLLVLLGVGEDDGESDASYVARKVSGLRVFEDDGGRMNLSLHDAGGSVLLVPQFTLHGDCRKGRRPSFAAAASPDKAAELYKLTAENLRRKNVDVETGQFRAHMMVHLVNDGPVTLLLDSKKQF